MIYLRKFFTLYIWKTFTCTHMKINIRKVLYDINTLYTLIHIDELSTATWVSNSTATWVSNFLILISYFLFLISYFSPTHRTGVGHRCTEAFKDGLELTHRRLYNYLKTRSQGGNSQTLISKWRYLLKEVNASQRLLYSHFNFIQASVLWFEPAYFL